MCFVTDSNLSVSKWTFKTLSSRAFQVALKSPPVASPKKDMVDALGLLLVVV
jgi:hypothetical protein